MTCDEIRRQLHEAHDDGRARALPELVRAHVAACGACRSLEEDLDALFHTLRSLPTIPLPGEALGAVWRDTIRRRSGSAPTSAGHWRLAAAAVYVSVVSAATLYLVLAPAPPPQPSPVELARASAQAELVLGYAARALDAARYAAADRVLASKVSPAVRGAAAPHPTRRP